MADQMNIPGTEPPAAGDPSGNSAAAGTGTSAAGSPSGSTGDPGAGSVPAPIEVAVPDGMDASAFELEAIKAMSSDSAQAQKVFDHTVATVKRLEAAADAQWKAINDGYIAAIKADSEIGGANVEANLVAVNRFLEEHFSEKAREVLKEVGNHPDVVRGLFRLSKHFQEDTSNVSGRPAGTDNDETARLKRRFPNSPEMFEGR